jgi:hypothetical protein
MDRDINQVWAFLTTYTDLTFFVGIQLVFPGIYQTDMGGKLGRYVLLLLFSREPLFSPERGVMVPFF